jgi:hypothetical protein
LRDYEKLGASYLGRNNALISIGATVVGALFGRKLGSVGNVGRATTAMRGVSRSARAG